MEYLRQLWNCLTSFCNCLHCTDDLGSQGYEPSERTYLLSDAVNISPAIRRTNSVNFTNDISPNSIPKKDDTSALSRLVQNTAINMIDVGAMDSHNLEHQEYNDRIKLYSLRLQQQWNNIQHPGIVSPGLLKDLPDAESVLIQPAIVDDIMQMKNVLRRVQIAVVDIKIDHKEAIVVPFRIP